MSCPFMKRDEIGACHVTEDVESPSGDHNIAKELTYHDYLQLDKILDAQTVKSDIPDEHLFIVTHQAYELWFKEIIYEIDVARKVFMEEEVTSGKLMDVVNRFKRILLTLKLLTNQADILETMTPFNFLQFRGGLFPASGFQSYQFRIMEIKLGLTMKERSRFEGTFKVGFKDQPKEVQAIIDAERETSLATCLDRWFVSLLEKQKPHFDFVAKYKEGVDRMLQDMIDEAEAEENEEKRNERKNGYKAKKNFYDSILHESVHNDRVMIMNRKLSHRAMLGALMIFLYSKEPAFNLAHQFLHLLMDVDTWIVKWRGT
ncbi:Tdo2p [Halocaridina rubra]|uniref:Tdo2p n=1 Tax=Halocaridina rubra TaxID=373956 RepID=A0AAN8WQZ3_HALRR